MLIVCPACASSYQVAAQSLGAGRTVRCARCRVEWFAENPDAPPPSSYQTIKAIVDDGDVVDAFEPFDAPEKFDEIEAERPPAEDPTPPAKATGRPARIQLAPRLFRRGNATPPARSSRRERWAPRRRLPQLKLRPAAVFAAVGSAALLYALTARADMVRYAPSLASLYAMAGLPVNVRGLEIAEVKSIEEIDEGVPILLVTGEIENVSGRQIDVPRLRLSVRAGDDRELYSWTTVVGRATLEAGERTPFRARLASPPAEGRGIAVRFLARQDLQAHLR